MFLSECLCRWLRFTWRRSRIYLLRQPREEVHYRSERLRVQSTFKGPKQNQLRIMIRLRPSLTEVTATERLERLRWMPPHQGPTQSLHSSLRRSPSKELKRESFQQQLISSILLALRSKDKPRRQAIVLLKEMLLINRYQLSVTSLKLLLISVLERQRKVQLSHTETQHWQECYSKLLEETLPQSWSVPSDQGICTMKRLWIP